jgi:L-iditol 2-dehydrogenase
VVAADPLAHRREAAAKFGADRVIDPAAGAADTLPEGAESGVDVAFEIAGTNDAVRLAIDAVRPGGRIVLAGIPDDDLTTFSASTARRKGLTMAMVRRMNEAYPRAISMAARGQVDLGPVVTHHFPLTDVAGAFSAANRRAGLKVIVEPFPATG